MARIIPEKGMDLPKNFLVPLNFEDARLAMNKMADLAFSVGDYSLDTETGGFSWYRDALYLVSIYTKDLHVLLSIGWKESKLSLCDLRILFKRFMFNPKVVCYMWNAKFDNHFLANCKVQLPNVEDGVTMGFLIDNRKPKKLKERYKLEMNLKERRGDFFDNFKVTKNKPLTSFPLNDVCYYAGLDAKDTYKLAHKFTNGGRSGKSYSVGGDAELTNLYDKVEKPLLPILWRMERAGIEVDTNRLALFRKDVIMPAIEKAQKSIYKTAGVVFNVNSPKQVKEIFARKKIFLESSDEKNLAILVTERGDKLAEAILEYRKVEKLRSTYVDGMMESLTNEKSLHCVFNQTGTETGRLSAEKPNMQNIPRLKEMREIFRARKGKLLVVKDYGQIELRVAAHVSNDPIMIDEFRRGCDIHRMSAATIFGKKPEDVTPAERQQGKSTTSFGVLFGMGSFNLAAKLKVDEDTADLFIVNFFRKYRLLDRFIKRVKSSAVRCGYVRTFLGRIRYIDELKSKEKWRVSEALRQAVNTTIQGGAADLVKLGMIYSFNHPEVCKLGARLLLQVHDETVWEVDADKAEALSKLLDDLLVNFPVAKKLTVPLTVAGGIGANWYDAKKGV